MATYNKIADFVEHVNEGVHNMASNQLVVALSNTAPASETGTLPTADGGGVLANVTQIAYTNLSSRNITLSTSSQTGGTYSLVLNDLTLSATGTVAQFRYVYVYNDTPTSPADPLICYFDYGSALDLTSGESLTIDWQSNGGTTGNLYTMT